MTKDEAKQKIAELVEKYENLSPSAVKTFNEANTKQGFIEPLFRALGWDVDDSNEVTLEEKASNGRVDYAFKLHGVSQFYLEAKPLKADLTNPDYIKQAITYAYGKGVTWVVLTDFEELRLFNAQQNKPFITLKCTDYLSTFDKLWLLSRESLAEGLLNKEAAQVGALPPSLPIETRLFRQLRQWREDLFNQLYLYDKKLSFSQIDEIIQRLFDRLIFIRTCEDRGIEDKRLLAAVHQWKTSGHKGELVDSIRQIFREFDGYYDSDLFAYHLTDEVFIEGTTLEQIISGLYEVPGGMASYDFSIIDADVLGAVYEQYLGHVAQVVKQRAKEAQAKLDLGIQTESITLTAKKERRKEQGIYYTPKFVTDYIVKETVGRFIKEHSVSEIRNIKILDPACGSGSFLIRAFDELLKYYASQKTSKSESDIDAADRISILTSNIFGVDLDIQAVEIARLNLLLRSLARRETLPSLKENIRQGNSLISGTEEELKKYFGDSWRDKKPFNWNEEFKDIMAQGGFDIVIGNPPYGAEFDKRDRAYIEDRYPHSKDNKNSAMVFIEKGLTLTKEGGFFSLIIPKSLAFSQGWANGRKLILDKLGSVCDTSKAFKEVLLEQMVIVVSQKFARKPLYEAVFLGPGGEKNQVSISKQTSAATDTILLGIAKEELEIFHKLTSSKLFMKDISKTARGLPFQKHLTKDPKGVQVYRGDHISRYALYETKETLPETVLSGADKKVSFLRQPKIMSQQIIAHVENPTEHIILTSTLDKDSVLTLDTVQNTVITDKRFAYGFVLALLNSKLWSWYAYRFIFSRAIRTMHFDDHYLGKLPLPNIDFDNSKDKKMHDKLVALVDKMLELNEKLAPIRDTYSNERDKLKEEIEKTDKEIDNLVYDLYGLTEEDRQVVEASVSKS